MAENVNYPGQVIPLTASGTVAKNRFVAPDGALPDSAGDIVLGVNTVDVVSGETLSVMINGTAKMELGGTVTLGAKLKSDAAGKPIAQGGSGEIAGIALGAGDAGDYIQVLVNVK